MRNRAKCKLCNEIIESVALTDMQFCSCGEIGVEGGTTLYRTYAKNFSNFLRVHDDGKEVEVTVKKKEEPMSPLSKEEKLKELESFIERLESLNSDALSASATNYDVLTICYFIKLLATD
jgi:hypothetical protein